MRPSVPNFHFSGDHRRRAAGEAVTGQKPDNR